MTALSQRVLRFFLHGVLLYAEALDTAKVQALRKPDINPSLSSSCPGVLTLFPSCSGWSIAAGGRGLPGGARAQRFRADPAAAAGSLIILIAI